MRLSRVCHASVTFLSNVCHSLSLLCRVISFVCHAPRSSEIRRDKGQGGLDLAFAGFESTASRTGLVQVVAVCGDCCTRTLRQRVAQPASARLGVHRCLSLSARCALPPFRALPIMDSLTLALFLIVILLAFILVLTVYVCFELRALRSRSGRVLSEASVAHAKRCVFELALSARGGAVGVGVFYAPSEAVTAAHNLNSARRGRVIYGRLHTPGGQVAEPLLIKLEVVSVNVELDFAT